MTDHLIIVKPKQATTPCATLVVHPAETKAGAKPREIPRDQPGAAETETVPMCPTCKSDEGVTPMADGYTCAKCGPFKPEETKG